MNQVNWILQKNLIDNNTHEALKREIQSDGEVYQEVYIVPFSEDLPFTLDSGMKNILYGTTSMIMNASRLDGYKNAIFYCENCFQIKVYLEHWKDKMLNYDGRILKISDFIGGNHENDKRYFVRPNEDTKSFSGLVTTFGEFKEMVNNAVGYSPYFQSDTLILVSEPKQIEKEWRNFMVDGKVVSSSRYCMNGQRSEDGNDMPLGMIEFAENCCKVYMPHDIFVMDVALSQGRYYIIECNCFNDTGFYDHDIQKIVKSVNESVRRHQ